MVRRRIGNDIDIEWGVYRGDTPEDFSGKTIELFIIERCGKKQKVDGSAISIDGNTIFFTWKAGNQYSVGNYSLVLKEYYNGELCNTVDIADAIELVANTALEDGDSDYISDSSTTFRSDFNVVFESIDKAYSAAKAASEQAIISESKNEELKISISAAIEAFYQLKELLDTDALIPSLLKVGSYFKEDENGDLLPKNKEDGTPRAIYTQSFITAGGKRVLTEEEEEIKDKYTLGELVNVREEVDLVNEEKDVFFIKRKTDTHWSVIDVSEVVGLDVEALKLYLEENGYINEESLTIALQPIIDKVDYLEKELSFWEKVNIGTEEAPIYALRPKEGIGIISDSFITAGGKNTTTSPSGVTKLEALTDVVIDSPTDGQVLSYDAELQKWVNASSVSGFDEEQLQSYLDTKKYVTEAWVLSQEYAKKSDLLEIEFNKVFEIVRDSNGNIVSIHALYGLWGDSYITAGGKNNSGTSTIGTLGSLTNVNNSVDAVYDTDVIIYKASGDTHYTVKSISEIGLNEEAIGAYLETNEYITKSYVDTVQSQLEIHIGTVSNRLETFLTEVDIDETINSWKELENFLAGYTETATLSDLLKVKADQTKVDELSEEVASNRDEIDKLTTYLNSMFTYDDNGNIQAKAGLWSNSFITAGGKGGSTSSSGVTLLSALSDVSIDLETITSTDVLVYNGAKWVNKTLEQIATAFIKHTDLFDDVTDSDEATDDVGESTPRVIKKKYLPLRGSKGIKMYLQKTTSRKLSIEMKVNTNTFGFNEAGELQLLKVDGGIIN